MGQATAQSWVGLTALKMLALLLALPLAPPWADVRVDHWAFPKALSTADQKVV